MDEVGETSSAPTNYATERPVVVRIKRKFSQSPVEAFWLEINERPLKRTLLDFGNLSLSESSQKEESRTRRIFVKHVETVSSSENTIDAVQSFMQTGSGNGSGISKNNRERHSFRKQNKQDQLLSKAKQEQEALSKSSRFELIWRSREGNKETVHDEELNEVCHLYDVDRVDAEGTAVNTNKHEKMSKEDQESLGKFLPLLRELVPDAADDIESDMDPNVSEQDDFVYDLYTVGDNDEEVDDSLPFLLVQVDDTDEWYDGPDDPDYETDDSNDENHHVNDYPEEESDESETSPEESSEEEEEETESQESSTDEDPKHLDIADDDMDNDYFDENSQHAYSDDDEEDDDSM